VARAHLHRADCPQALAILHALLAHRPDTGSIGYQPTAQGASVDWDTLTDTSLSTTETAAVHIARGVAIVEAHGGGLPGHLHHPIARALESLDPDPRTQRAVRRRLRAARPDQTNRPASNEPPLETPPGAAR
jgi:hypothetical protein